MSSRFLCKFLLRSALPFIWIIFFTGCNPFGSSSVDASFSETTTSTVGGTVISGGSCTAGTAIASNVLAGATFPDGSGGMVTGTMVNNNTVNLSTASPSVAGFYSGFTNGSPSSATICSGTTILAVPGNAVCSSSNTLTIETAADGSGSAISTLSVASGTVTTLYSILRNSSGVFISNPSASWMKVGTGLLSSTTGTSNSFTARGGDTYVAAVSSGLGTTTQALTGTFGSPLGIAGIRLWLKADAGITKNGSNLVSSWADQSGNGIDVTQATDANKPTWVDAVLNGKPVIRFTRSVDQSLTNTGALAASGAFTIIAVVAQSSLAGEQMPISWGVSGQGNQLRSIYNNGGVFGFAGWGNEKTSTHTMTLNTFTLLETTLNSTFDTMKFYVNGVAKGTVAIAGLAAPNNTISVGRLSAGGNYGLEGDIAEIIVYDNEIASGDRTDIEAYITGKYGI